MRRIHEKRRAVAWAGAALLALVTGCGGAAGFAAPEVSAAKSPAADAPAPAPPPPPPPGDVGGNFFGGDARGGAPAAAREEQSKKAPPDKKPAPGQPATGTAVKGPGTGAAEAVQKQAPIIIYTAHLTMAVFEVENGIRRIEAIGKELGGFLAKREDSSIVIRVPSERFEEALRAIEKSGDMLHRSVSAEDVTEEYRDVEIRLRAAKAVQERLTQLLSRAQKVEESIAIERELDRVTVEIDRLEGRMKFLRDRAAFSTITVTFQPKAQENVSQNPFKMPTPWLNQLGLSRLFSL